MAGCSVPGIVVLEDPLTPEEHLNLGLAYEQKKEFKLAVREYKLAVDDLPIANHYLGNSFFQMEEYDQAEKWYRKAIEKLPEDPNPNNNLAWLFYTKKENLKEAETLARRALELAPEDARQQYQDTLDHILAAQQVMAEEGRMPPPKPAIRLPDSCCP